MSYKLSASTACVSTYAYAFGIHPTSILLIHTAASFMNLSRLVLYG